MNLNHSTARLIRDALSNQCINITALIHASWFKAEVEKKAAIYYEYSDDERSLADVERSTWIGELGEYAIYYALLDKGFDVFHNDEAVTRQLYWDIFVYGALCEVKFKSQTDPYNFSFDTKSKDKTMFKEWSKFDLIISFYMKKHDGETYVIPWLLIDNAALDQNLKDRDDLPLYRDSIKEGNKGRYLRKERAEELGLMTRLNVTQNEFHFQAVL